MPLLKFRCKKCGRVFDELTALNDMEKIKCPACGGNTERAYEGKCAFSKSCEGCGGNCGSCGGCGH